MITINDIQSFLNEHNYDLRISKNSRWLDQKVTYDVSSIIADCVLNYVDTNGDSEFNCPDIWHSTYTANNILAIFNKPNVNEAKTKNEYDKFFSQPLLFLASANVLTLTKRNKRNFYTVNNRDILEFISSREYNAFIFMTMYIEKVMTDSGLWPLFDSFFSKQNKESFNILKISFGDFLRKNTPINGDLEPNRIFSKVINPLAVSRRKLGTKRGHISQSIISLSDLQYNQPNFRDLHTKKPKDMSRKDWAYQLNQTINSSRTSYQVSKTKKFLHRFNDEYRDSQSELQDAWKHGTATQMHHIFPAADFPEISDTLENLIAITPTQHLTKAHPNNNTQIIDKLYQKEILLCKLANIRDNLSNKHIPQIYNFQQFVTVIATGFDMDLKIDDNDYLTLENIIKEHYTI